MSNGGINTTGGININFPLGSIGSIFGSGGGKEEADAFRLPNEGLKNLPKQQDLALQIEEAIARGETPAKKDVKNLASLEQRFDDIEERFDRRIIRLPGLFTKAGIPLGVTFLQAIWIASQTKRGQKILAKFPLPLEVLSQIFFPSTQPRQPRVPRAERQRRFQIPGSPSIPDIPVRRFQRHLHLH